MAKLTLTSSEPLDILLLIEQLVPGTNLSVIKKAISKVTFRGDITLTKPVGDDVVSLQVIISE